MIDLMVLISSIRNQHFQAAGRLLLVFVVGLCGTAIAGETKPLVDLDATALTPGPIRSWPNAGTLGGEFLGGAETAPAAADVGGRRALTVGEGRFLTSSFKASPEMTGSHPFTLVVQAYAPAAVKRDVLVSWASRPNNTAEFGYGAGPDGAFFGWDKAAKFTKFPAAAAWHQIAYTYDGEALHVYVDGALDGQRPMKMAIKPGGTIYLGTAWNGVDQKPLFPFHGSLARVLVWGSSLSQREIRNAGGSYESFDPSPADGATVAAENVQLHWQPGSDQAKSFAVRLASDESALDSDSAAMQRQDAPEFQPPGLTPGHAYFWRVDELDSAGKLIAKGSAWRFFTDIGLAQAPSPRNRVAGVTRETKLLGWKPGRYARSQAVYFGTDQSAVTNGTAAVTKDLAPTAASLPIPVAHLEPGTTYYWRVAEDNGSLEKTADAPVAGSIAAIAELPPAERQRALEQIALNARR